MPEDEPALHERFRDGPFAADQGAYDQLIKVLQPVIDPGGVLEMHHYFFGYGEIRAAKACCWPSSDLFQVDGSRVEHSLQVVPRDGRLVVRWGSLVDPISPGAADVILSFGGIGVGERRKPGTLFVDNTYPRPQGDQPPRLYTEMNLDGNPPVRYVFKTRRKIKPGKYFVDFNFTYHDGKGWRSSTRKVEFQVRNFLERFAVPIGVLAICATVLSIGRTLRVDALVSAAWDWMVAMAK